MNTATETKTDSLQTFERTESTSGEVALIAGEKSIATGNLQYEVLR